jgi:hypothetical protein
MTTVKSGSKILEKSLHSQRATAVEVVHIFIIFQATNVQTFQFLLYEK